MYVLYASAHSFVNSLEGANYGDYFHPHGQGGSMTHPSKPALQALRLPYDDKTYHPAITQAFGVVSAMEPAVYDYGDGVYGWVWEPGASQNNTHTGIDWGLDGGTPLLAVATGTVRACTPPDMSYGFGNLTILDHGNRLLSFYAHQSRFGCTPGQTVRKGDTIGYVGTTGNSTGDHLHFATGMDDLAGYYDFFSPTPYLLYQVPQDVQLPTAARYKVLVDMFMRTAAQLDAPHGVLVKAGTIVVATGGWTTHWRQCRTPDAHTGWLFAANLSAAG
jgi:hypothetical protein